MSQSEAPQPNVVIAGHVCIDHNETEGHAYTKWGSPAMYIADYLYRQHAITPTIITSYGRDFIPYAEHVRLLPAEPQTDTSLIFRNIITPTSRTWYSENTEVAVPPALTPEAIKALETADIFVLGTILPNYPPAAVRELLSYLRPDCVTGVIVQGYLRHVTPDSKIIVRDFAEAAEILPLFNITVLSTEDHPDATAMVEREWRQLAGSQAIVLTEGDQGATIFQNGQRQHVPTTPIPAADIVDSVGCGDVFVAALLYALYAKSRGDDLPAAVRFAHQATRHKLLAS